MKSDGCRMINIKKLSEIIVIFITLVMTPLLKRIIPKKANFHKKITTF